MLPVEWLVGPVAALALALYVSRLLWIEHQKHDADVLAQRDRNAAGWEAQTAASTRAAAAAERSAEALDRLAAERASQRRIADGET